MEHKTDEFNQAKNKLATDIKTVITGGEAVLKDTANVSSAGIAAVREKIDQKLCSAKGMLFDASRPAVDKARRTATTANNYVHGNPWTVIGFAVAASALIGFLASKR